MDSSGAVANGVGQAVRRKEDARFLIGEGSYGDDQTLPNLAHAVLVRSPHAHARIRAIDSAAAKQAPGVLIVLTGADFIADGLQPIPHNPGVTGAPDVVVRLRMAAPIGTPDYPMPADKARFVGEPVAMVVAETIEQAKDAAELVEIDYEALPAVTACHRRDEASARGRCCGRRRRAILCVDVEVGDAQATDARVQARGSCRAARYLGAARHRRADGGAHSFDWRLRPVTPGQYMLHAGTGQRRSRSSVMQPAASSACRRTRCCCVCKDMGGNFGTRNFFFPRVCACCRGRRRRAGWPVKWTCPRAPRRSSPDYQGRDLCWSKPSSRSTSWNGRFIVIRGSNISINVGAHAAAPSCRCARASG